MKRHKYRSSNDRDEYKQHKYVEDCMKRAGE